MSVRRDSRPTFGNPPVVETVLSVQFEPLRLKIVYLALLWKQYSTEFPKTEERARLDPTMEQFPERPQGRFGLKLQALEDPPAPRLWFVSSRGNEMIQVQNDRFVKNWRKEGEGEEYPRYEEVIRPNFDRDYSIFLSFLASNGLGKPRVNQCEVTYVNHIIAGEGWDRYGEVDKIFSFWRTLDVFPPGPLEDARMHTRFVIPDGAGKAIGRLHFDLQPAVRTSDNHPMYVLHLTARGQLGDGVEFLDVGRDWIVRTFKALTTDSMHKVWRIKSDA